jgi:hypothetical protein
MIAMTVNTLPQSAKNPFLSVRYQIAAPPSVPATAPLWLREVKRRGDIISLVMLLTLVLAVFPYVFSPSAPIAGGLLFALVCDSIAIFGFNRRGKIVTAGIIITLTTELGMLVNLAGQIFLFRGYDLGFVPFLTLLMQPTAVAISTLRPHVVFFFFLVNSAFILAIFFFVPHALDVTSYLATPQGLEGILVTPLSALLMTFFAITVWVTSANHAIAQADEADLRASYAEAMAQKRS